MKVAVVLLALLVVASAAPGKRFWRPQFLDEILDKLKHAFSAAKDEFVNLTKHIAGGIDFDAVLAKLTPLINSRTTQNGCISVCKNGAASVLGAAASLASTACSPLCKAALAQIEEHAGK